MKPSLLSAAAVWRALPAIDRLEIVNSMENDRDRIEEVSSNYVLPHDIRRRDAVLATCDAAISLLRIAGEPEGVDDPQSEALRRRPDQEPR